MKWHVVCNIDGAEQYSPNIDSNDEYCLPLTFSGGDPQTKIRESASIQIEEQYSAKLSGKAKDFLLTSTVAYIADLCVPRTASRDRWTRSFVLHIPVFEMNLWKNASTSLSAALRFLTGDEWFIKFRKRAEVSPPGSISEGENLPSKVCLLSGGLDSLAGAIDLLADGSSIAFVSHHGGGSTPQFQNQTYQSLRAIYKEQCHENQFYIVAPQLDGGENSMRSRSIMFLGLGISIATILGDDIPLYVPENGLISLNIPLTHSRSGSSSTRTTHPYFISLIRSVLADLRISNPIVMPYKHKTKGEMLQEVAEPDVLKSTLDKTMSCSHPELARWAGGKPGTHCGYCVPCIIRRASVHAASLESSDCDYTKDILSDSLQGKQKSDLFAFKTAMRRAREYPMPSFLRVQESGPLPANELDAFSQVYDRGMAEVANFVSSGV